MLYLQKETTGSVIFLLRLFYKILPLPAICPPFRPLNLQTTRRLYERDFKRWQASPPSPLSLVFLPAAMVWIWKLSLSGNATVLQSLISSGLWVQWWTGQVHWRCCGWLNRWAGHLATISPRARGLSNDRARSDGTRNRVCLTSECPTLNIPYNVTIMYSFFERGGAPNGERVQCLQQTTWACCRDMRWDAIICFRESRTRTTQVLLSYIYYFQWNTYNDGGKNPVITQDKVW